MTIDARQLKKVEVDLLNRIHEARRSGDVALTKKLQKEYDDKYVDPDYAIKAGYAPAYRPSVLPPPYKEDSTWNGDEVMAIKGKTKETKAEAQAKLGKGKDKPAAAKPAKEAKAPKAPKEPKEKGPRAPKGMALTDKITFGTDKDQNAYGPKNNPKKAGSKSHANFAKYKSGMTVAAALAAGVTSGDLAWDKSHGFINVGE